MKSDGRKREVDKVEIMGSRDANSRSCHLTDVGAIPEGCRRRGSRERYLYGHCRRYLERSLEVLGYLSSAGYAL